MKNILRIKKNYMSNPSKLLTLANVISGYEMFKNQAEYQLIFLIQGPSGGSTIQESQSKANYLISIAELRKDCVACVSPHRSGVVNVSNSDTQTENIIDFFDPVNSSSYAVFDSGYKYVYDRFNNQFRWIALNGDTANKIGTLQLAILAKYYSVPFYVAAPISTFDKDSKS